MLTGKLALLTAAAALLTAALSATGQPASARAAPSFLIQASASFQRLGDYWVSDKPDYAGAIEALGPASSCHLVNGNPAHAVASWRTLGVSMVLVTFGGIEAGKTGCTAPEAIHVSTVRVTGKRWYTSLKLQIGHTAARLRQLYPRAKASNGQRGWYRPGYWLVTRRTVCLGRCETRYVTAPVLVAETKDGRVQALVFVVGAQGE